MLVSQKQLTELLKAFGVDTAGSWPLPRLVAQVNSSGGIKRFAPDGDFPDMRADLRALHDEIVYIQKEGKLIEVVPDVESQADVGVTVTTTKVKPKKRQSGGTAAAPRSKPKTPKPPKKKPAPVPGKKYAISTDPGLTWKERLAKWKKTPYRLTTRGSGIVRTIIEELEEAGRKGTTITKSEIHTVLREKFPDRDPVKLWRTVSNQVPTQLRQYRQLDVRSNEDDHRAGQSGREKGYYLIPDNSSDETSKKTSKKTPKKKATAKS